MEVKQNKTSKEANDTDNLKNLKREELITYLKALYMTEEQRAKFTSFFYPKGQTSDLKPAEFCSVGIVEHISYLPLSIGENYINTSESLEKFDYTYWRRIKGDGNCYYRSVLINYLEILILTTFESLNPNIFFSLIKDVYFTEFPDKYKVWKKNTITSLLHMYETVERYDVNLCFDMLYRCYNKCDVIEKTLIQWLRFKLASFLKSNLDFEVNGFKLIQLIPGFELEDDLSYNKSKVIKYIDLELNRMNEFVEGYPLYITPLILDLEINIFYIEESGSYKAIPIDIKYEEGVRSQIVDIENYLWRFNGCKYTINTLFRVPHYDTIYIGQFIEELVNNYNNPEAYLQYMAMNEDEYDRYLESIRLSTNKARKERNPLSSILKDNTSDMTIDNESKNNHKKSGLYKCKVCAEGYKIVIDTQCDERICKQCFENYINQELNKCKKSKFRVGDSPSEKIIETFKLFKIKGVRCFNQKCHIEMQFSELKKIIDTHFINRKVRKDDRVKQDAETRFCKMCTRQTPQVIMIHGCLVCAPCQRHSIKLENQGQIILVTKNGNARRNMCALCQKVQVEIDDMQSLFTKDELEKGYIY
jgi:hypothetical protein